MNLNIYRTQILLGAVERILPAHSFFRSTFFPNLQTFVTEEVLLDYKKSKRKMAPFVAPRVGGITMDRQGYRTDKYAAPKIAPQRAITVDDLVIRGMGENVFSQRTPEQRQSELIGKDLAELDEMIARREEWMCRELLLNGKITMKGYIDRDNNTYVEQLLDYGFTNKEILTGGAVWSAETSAIYADLARWRLNIIQRSGRAPKVAILGQNASAEFCADSDINEKLKQYNGLFAELRPVIQDDALTHIGRLPELGLDLYTYNEWYIDDDGTEKPMMPVDHVILGRPGMGEILYGAVTQMESDGQFYTYEGTRVPKSWADTNNEQRMVRLSGRPVPKPEDIDDWFVAKVL
ncbi:major capsid protein [Gorillibacterium sp. sgz5001074]|uniref:major capsid protein n=1 Tax=Gorillibacterium sp. sgz5001074 TaxID=3446695 RepID=UPI003F6739B5